MTEERRVAVVTGASRGVGRGVALALGDAGMRVYVTGRTTEGDRSIGATAEEIVAEKPQVAQFIAYYLNNVNSVIGDVGYFPAPDAALQEAADNIKTAAGF